METAPGCAVRHTGHRGGQWSPQLTTTYFLASTDGTVQLSVNATRQKLKNLVANPKVALHIQDTVEYVRYLELRGDASVEPDDDYVVADRLGAKYGGVDWRNMDRPGERHTVVTIKLTRVRAVDMRQPDSVGTSLKR
jgi:hypothetical protein